MVGSDEVPFGSRSIFRCYVSFRECKDSFEPTQNVVKLLKVAHLDFQSISSKSMIVFSMTFSEKDHVSLVYIYIYSPYAPCQEYLPT